MIDPTPSQVPPDLFSSESIRRALRAWASAKTLGAHPLADLAIVQARCQGAGYSDTPAGRGLALREVILSAIETTRPVGAEPDQADRRWRPYIILSEQYIHERTPEAVAGQLIISRRTYYNEQELAMELLGDILYKWESQAASNEAPVAVQAKTSTPLRTNTAHPSPFLAPPRPNHPLVGRENLLADVKERLLATGQPAAVALQGLPGAGKTALAIELAHDPEVRTCFSDGVLWTGLGRKPDVAAQMSAWAAALGIPDQDISRQASLAQRAHLIHTAIGARRMLLVVDDAWQIEPVLAFRMGGPNCAYLLTTRLVSVASDFAGPEAISLHELAVSEGIDLLTQLAPQAVSAEPEEVQRLVEAVGGLPLALILAGRHLHRQSFGAQTRRIRAALVQLNETETRLRLAQPISPLEQRPDLLPDTPTSLQAIIGISDTALDETTRQVLRRLACFPPKPNSFPEAAALAVAETQTDTLDILVDHGLLECVGNDRYTLHQTIADYARLACESAEPARRQTMQRLSTYWAHFATKLASNFATFERELSNLLAGLDAAWELKDGTTLVCGANALAPFLLQRGLCATVEKYFCDALSLVAPDDLAGRYQLLLTLEKAYELQGKREPQLQALADLQTLAESLADDYKRAETALRRAIYSALTSDFQAAAAAAQQAVKLGRAVNAVEIEAAGYFWWGSVLMSQADYAEANGQLEQALTLARAARLRNIEADSLRGLGNVALRQEAHRQAIPYYEQALSLSRAIGDRRCEGATFLNMGVACVGIGDYEAARGFYEQAVSLSHQTGDRRVESLAIGNLGELAIRIGNLALGREHFCQALAIVRQVGDRYAQGNILSNLGEIAVEEGDFDQARDLLNQGLSLYREIGYQRGESITLDILGRLAYLEGDNAAARQYGEQALRLASEVGTTPFQASALNNLGFIHLSLGELNKAREMLQQAYTLRRDLKQDIQAIEPLAGLASVHQMCGDMAQALACVDEILPLLVEMPPHGLIDAMSVLLACYQVLSAAGDARARPMLAAAYQKLQEQAACIPDPARRRMYLENIPSHRGIVNNAKERGI